MFKFLFLPYFIHKRESTIFVCVQIKLITLIWKRIYWSCISLSNYFLLSIFIIYISTNFLFPIFKHRFYLSINLKLIRFVNDILIIVQFFLFGIYSRLRLLLLNLLLLLTLFLWKFVILTTAEIIIVDCDVEITSIFLWGKLNGIA